MSDRINPSVPIIERPELAARLPRELRARGARCFRMNGCGIILAHEPEGWHLSISRADRDPSWGEIATARYRLLPQVAEMAMYLPPLDEYVNLHPYTFHLLEVRRNRIVLPYPGAHP